MKLSKTRSEHDAARIWGDYSPSIRLIQVRSMVEAPGGTTIDAIRKRIGVTRMTVYRLLRALEASGLTIKEQKIGKTKRLSVEGSARKETIRLSRQQMISLFLVRQVLGWLRGTVFMEALDDVFAQLEATLRHADVVAGRNLDRKLYDRNEGALLYDRRVLRSEHVDALLDGLLHEQRLRVRHLAVQKGELAFEVEPLTLFVYKKGLYLACYSLRDKAQRRYALDRFRSIEWIKGARFDYPAAYKPEQLFLHAFGIFTADGKKPETVRIRFSPRLRGDVGRRHWHKSQRFEELASGAVVMTLKVALTEDLITWIVTWGDLAEVLEPPELRAKVESAFERALDRYRRRAEAAPAS
jgi:predicted DNA-binding transcriptional regulator YafY